jgi:hypothetical protein
MLKSTVIPVFSIFPAKSSTPKVLSSTVTNAFMYCPPSVRQNASSTTHTTTPAPQIQESKPKVQRKARATGGRKKKKQWHVEPHAPVCHRRVSTGAARNQPEGPPEEAENAGESIGEVRVWRRGPIRRKSSTQKSETPTATSEGTAHGGHQQQC